MRRAEGALNPVWLLVIVPACFLFGVIVVVMTDRFSGPRF